MLFNEVIYIWTSMVVGMSNIQKILVAQQQASNYFEIYVQ